MSCLSFYLFCYSLKTFIIGEAQVSNILIYKLSPTIPYFLFRVFFSQFLISLYCLLSLRLQLLIYFLLIYYQLAIRTVYYIDYIYYIQGPSFKTKQYFSSPFLITAQILSSLWLISLGVANKPYLFSVRWISSRS